MTGRPFDGSVAAMDKSLSESAEPVTLAETAGPQRVGHAIASRLHLSKGELLPVPLQADFGGPQHSRARDDEDGGEHADEHEQHDDAGVDDGRPAGTAQEQHPPGHARSSPYWASVSPGRGDRDHRLLLDCCRIVTRVSVEPVGEATAGDLHRVPDG